MAIVDDDIRDKFLLYKMLVLIPSVITLINIILRNKHNKFYVASNYITYVYANRSTKSKVISIIAVTINVFISNVLFFFLFFNCAAKFWQTVFNNTIKINTLIPLLDLFIGAVISSCMCVLIGYVAHTIVLKKHNLSFKDFVVRGELEDELLCTGIFALLFVMSLRICAKLLYLFRKLVFGKLKLDVYVSLESVKLKILIVRNVRDKIKIMLSDFNDICRDFKELSKLMGPSFVAKLNTQRNAIAEECKHYEDRFKFLEDVCDSYNKKFIRQSHVLVKCANNILMDLRSCETHLHNIMVDIVDSLKTRRSKKCNLCKSCKILLENERELNVLIHKIETLLDEPMVSSVRIDVIVGCASGNTPCLVDKCYYG
ncbi:hypothetical protein [Ehrlichia ruminantium]|nr:hypothetical protein [Ehrlichia ruminantium]